MTAIVILISKALPIVIKEGIAKTLLKLKDISKLSLQIDS